MFTRLYPFQIPVRWSTQMGHRILIVDDDAEIRDLLREVFSREKYVLLAAGSAEEALGVLSAEKVDVVISDEKMPGMPGSEFLARVRKEHPDTVRIMLTGHANLDSAIRAINEGEIFRFFTKPCNVVELAATVRQAIRFKTLSEENDRLLMLAKKQFSKLEEIEKQYPGITEVNSNAQGEIVFEEDWSDDELDGILEKIHGTGKDEKEHF